MGTGDSCQIGMVGRINRDGEAVVTISATQVGRVGEARIDVSGATAIIARQFEGYCMGVAEKAFPFDLRPMPVALLVNHRRMMNDLTTVGQMNYKVALMVQL